MRNRLWKSITLAAALLLAITGFHTGVAHASYPEKTVRLVIPFPPGGATDTLARILAEHLSRDLGQPVIVDNRSGAGTMLGSGVVAKAPADGYTLLMTVPSLIQTPHLLSKPPFDPLVDFTPIAQIVTSPLAIAVNAETGIKTAADLVKYVKTTPGNHAYATYGPGSSGHLYMHTFTEQAGLDWTHIPYRGEGAMITDLLGGQVSAIIITGGGAGPYVKSGRINVVALTGHRHMDSLPGSQTLAEQGYNRISSLGWFSIFGPGKMNPAVVQTLSDSLMKGLKDPNIIQRIENLGLMVDPLPAQEFAAVVKRDHDMWKAVIDEVGVKLD